MGVPCVSQPHKVCPACHTPAPLPAGQCIRCGHRFRTAFGGPRTDVCAVLALALALASLLIFPALLGPAAFVLGIVALYRIRETPTLAGKPLAVAGVVVGLLSIGYALWQDQRRPMPTVDRGERQDLSLSAALPCRDAVRSEWTEGSPRRHYAECVAGHRYWELNGAWTPLTSSSSP